MGLYKNVQIICSIKYLYVISRTVTQNEMESLTIHNHVLFSCSAKDEDVSVVIVVNVLLLSLLL